ncbi:unnamed protein product [Effrenium voratum]|nr:unnamed protein product [Effrenium voratum]
MQGCDPPAQAADLTSAPTSPRSSLQERAFVESIEPDEGRPHGTAILEKLQQILEKYGTVGTYLVQRHAEPGEAKDFLARLHDLGREDLPFHALQATLPSTPASAGPQARDTLRLPLGAFSYALECSSKPDADNNLVMQLAESIWQHGFTSAEQPLLVTQSAELLKCASEGERNCPAPWWKDGSLKPHCVGFIKGKARLHSLLAVLRLVWDCSMKLEEVNPLLAASVKSIYVQCVSHSSKRDEILHNFRMSVQGSLRKGPSVVCWVQSLQNLVKAGESDIESVIRKHNSDNPKHGQLLGAKAVAVRTSMPSTALQAVISHVQSLGWAQCCFSDDCLGSKKLLPNFQFRSQASQKWNKWLKTTEASSVLCLQHAVASFTLRPEVARRKWSKAELETMAEQAAFVTAIAREAQNECPLDDAKLQAEWLDPWVQGDHAVQLEVTCVLGQKDPQLTPRGVRQLRELLEAHAAEMPLPSATAGSNTVERTNLEAEAFELLKKRIEYDLQCVRVFKARTATHESTIYHQQLMHRKHAMEVSHTAATSFMSANVAILHSLRVDEVLREISQVEDSSQARQSELAGILLNGGSPSIGILLLPEFTYKRGLLFEQEYSCVQLLSQKGINLDRGLVLQFQTRKDSRDSRPLNYRGRILQGLNNTDTDWAFRASALVRDGRTAPAEQLAANSMVYAEDVDPEALPKQTDPDGLVSGSKKTEQIGTDAHLKLLDAALDGLVLEGKSGLVLVDLHIGVADSLDAWLKKRSGVNSSTLYIGITDEPVVRDWVIKTKTDSIAQAHMKGEFKIPGCQPAPAEAPADMIHSAPKAPALNVLLLSGKTPVIPDTMMKD